MQGVLCNFVRIIENKFVFPTTVQSVVSGVAENHVSGDGKNYWMSHCKREGNGMVRPTSQSLSYAVYLASLPISPFPAVLFDIVCRE